jgi:hypothetical protein
MRVAVIVIGIVMVSTPSYASKSCMSQAEARRELGQVHLYWHGSGHCWDAKAGGHGFIRHARHSGVRQAHRDVDEDDEPEDQAQGQAKDQAKEQAKDQPKDQPKDQANVTAPKWRNAMSEMLPTDAPVFRSAAAIEVPLQTDAQPEGPNWLDRWVEVIPVFPRIQASHAAAAAVTSPSQPEKIEPMVTPVRVLLAFLAIALIIGVIEILFRSTIHEYRR